MNKTSTFRKLLSKPWVRAQACAWVLGSIVLSGGAAYAAHRARYSALQLGSEILTNVAPMQGAESLSFNGAHFFFANQVVNAKLDDVIAGAESLCKKDGADLQRDLAPTLAHLPASMLAPALPSQVDFSTLLTTSKKNGKSGEVACWVRRKDLNRTAMERVKAFAQSLDMSTFGSLQFMHAEAIGENKTMVRMLWSEGGLALRQMFPESKDTPGHDLPDLPRPLGSFRVVSAHVDGAQRDLVSYQSPQTPEQLDAFYAQEMKTRGWEEVDLGERSEEDRREFSQHAYRKAGRAALLALTPGDEFTDATFIEMPPR